ncbi:MAG TPA: hypothetical protein VEH27_07255 [Methylomirabilota bacterium]|nr:hypothetical protein [Methylomirabilota bacterium]
MKPHHRNHCPVAPAACPTGLLALFTRLKLLMLLALALSAGKGFAADALLVVSGVPLNASDAILQERLVAAGFNVQAIAAASSSAADAAGKQLVVISESVSSGAVNTKFRNVEVGVVVIEPFILDDMLMVAGAENTATGFGLGGGATSALNIVRADHPLAGGLPAGEIAIVEGAAQTGWGNPAASAVVVATLAGDPPANQPATRAALFGYEKGAQMAGLVAPAKRSFIFTHGAILPLLNESGVKLLDAAINWTRSSLADLPPQITGLAPADQSLFVNANAGFTFTATTAAPNSISADDIKVTLNGQDVSSQLAISGSATARAASLSGLQANMAYSGVISVKDNLGRETVQAFGFDTFAASAFHIEAEDFNFGSGQFIENPPPSGEDLSGNIVGSGSGYYEQIGTAEVDFHDSTAAADPAGNHRYRSADVVGTQPATDETRQKYVAAAGGAGRVLDYHLSFVAAGDWVNYTRTFPAGAYQVYLRTTASATNELTLAEVTGDRTQPNQSANVLGSFRVAPTGGKYRFVPLTDALGAPAPISLSGVKTLRLTAVTANNGLHPNFILFVPVAQQLGPYVKAAQPAPNAVNVPVSAGLAIEIANRGSSVSVGSIKVFLNGAEITSSANIQAVADGARITATPALQPGAQQKIRVTFQSTGSQSFSEEWSFTTTSDVTGPMLRSAGTLDGLTIGLLFNEPLDQGTATEASNYRVGGTIPTEARLGSDNSSMILTLSAPVGNSFPVTVSNVKDQLNNAVAANTQITGAKVNVTPTDIGDVIAPGAAVAYGNGSFDVEANGAEIGASADSFFFLPTQVTGDFDLRVRMASLEAVNRLSKAGIIARETLDAGSRMIAAVVTPRGPTQDGVSTGIGDNDYQALIRNEAAGTTTLWPGSNTSREVPYPNAWIRLARQRGASGDVFTAYRSENGSAWTQFAQTTVNPGLAPTLHVGLGATPQNNGDNRTATAVFRDFGTTPAGIDPSLVRLSATRQGDQIQIAWPAAAEGYKLQMTSQLSGGWSDVTASPALSGTSRVITVPAQGSKAFFRLVKP